MRLTIAYSKIKKQNLVLIKNGTYQRETLSERPIRQPLTVCHVKQEHYALRNLMIYSLLLVFTLYRSFTMVTHKEVASSDQGLARHGIKAMSGNVLYKL